MEEKSTVPAHDKQFDSIARLPVDKQSDYKPFLLGNDTPLTTKQVREHQIGQDFVLVGTALFRSVDIALKLAANQAVSPKVLIIDNSKKVGEVWAKIKTFFEETPDDPLEDTLNFIVDDLVGDVIVDLANMSTSPIAFFSELFKNYPFEYIRKVIASLEVIEQDWGDTAIFKEVAQQCGDMPIAVYASNIIPWVSPEAQPAVLASINALNPFCTFCTNLDDKARRPTKSFVFTEPDIIQIAKQLELDETVQASCEATQAASLTTRGDSERDIADTTSTPLKEAINEHSDEKIGEEKNKQPEMIEEMQVEVVDNHPLEVPEDKSMTAVKSKQVEAIEDAQVKDRATQTFKKRLQSTVASDENSPDNEPAPPRKVPKP